MVDLRSIRKTATNTLAGKIEEQNDKQLHRPYIGASGLGHSCERYLWYTFRWCYEENFTARQIRLFDRGHREEAAIESVLFKAGLKVWGQQFECEFAFGHAKGHGDGMCIGVPEAPKTVHLNEYKTLNDKNFKDLKKSGVKVSKPVYYAQAQLYMKFFKLTRTLFIGVNKNNDEWYIERLKYDKDFAEELVKRAENIILSEEPPEKRYEPTWYQCKWCSANTICHGSESPNKTCRICTHVDILPEGKWECSTYNLPLATGQQRLGMQCRDFEMIEGI